MISNTHAASRSGPQTPTTGQIFDMAWPMALRAVMMFSIVIIDLYLVSSLGEEAVAAIGIATVITGTVLGISLAFGNAMQIKVAQAFGTEDPLELKTAFYGGLVIMCGCSRFRKVIFRQFWLRDRYRSCVRPPHVAQVCHGPLWCSWALGPNRSSGLLCP